MKRAREVVRELGGIEASRVFTRIWLALFGEWRWNDLPALPPEVILLPSWFPLNIYDFACWARQTIVPLTIVAAHRPCRPLPFSLSELRVGGWRETELPLSTWGGRFQRARPRAALVRAPPAAPAAHATPCSSAPSGSSAARRPTAAGAASSRPGSTRCWRCTCWATRWITR